VLRRVAVAVLILSNAFLPNASQIHVLATGMAFQKEDGWALEFGKGTREKASVD
jgi:hypothetical protein